MKFIFKVIRKIVKVLLDILVKIESKISLLVNYKKPKIFIYTDSRGFDVINKWGKNNYYSYAKALISSYRVDYIICPEKYTTIVDFLSVARQKKIWGNYDYIILHCGIVDFSPRPLSNIDIVKESKQNDAVFDQLFRYNKTYYEHPSDILYYGEQTVNIYSKQYLIDHILPTLADKDNLIWINSNRIIDAWTGNYTKGRPANINSMLSEFQGTMEGTLKNIINLNDWSDADIMKYTIDNMHFTQEGLDEVGKMLSDKINSLECMKMIK